MGEEKEMLDPNVVGRSVPQCCRCNELEERCKKAEVRCEELGFELQKKKEHCEELGAKVMALEGEKFEFEDKVKVLSKGLERLKEVSGGEIKPIVDLAEDNDKVLQCEKIRAESEVEVWKDKYKKLESWALQFGMGRDGDEENGKEQESKPISNEGNLHLDTSFGFWQNLEKVAALGNKKIGDIQSVGTPSDGIFHRSHILDVLPSRKTKQLTFQTEESHGKNMAPSTLIDRQGSESISVSACFAADGKESNNSSAQNNQDSLDLDENLLFVATPKRKRTCNVVTSESESDDDNILICKLKRKHIQEPSSDQVRPDLSSSPPANISEDNKVTDSVMTRRRLWPLRKCARKSQDDKISSCRPRKAKNQQSIPTNDDADDESEEDLSYSEGENMSDFIVDDSDVSNCEDTSSTSQDVANSDVADSDSANSQDVQDSNMESYSQDVSDEDMDFGNILSKIQRSKTNMKWEFEADMLAAFGKDPELCMKAVCALYRQQTSEEQMSKGALLSNQRGFNKFDAYKGSILAEFLTDGDPYGGLKKSVKELQENDPEAVELCRSLATHYSKQLYEIYKNKEDPLFPG
ncbi:hypothetical protein AAZX31_13G027200 [Glycine max]|uniref:Uncharacterized protein n=1 Tax=Glycine max TaxID=3847 RepID=A0A0R0GI79_SOYBN|nr:hypothetical protein GYH30_035069 [Glycine max]KRH18128.1 hypothetical protein GLYMA_13G040000v4 [Glycine max]